jgi:hypothetical protein
MKLRRIAPAVSIGILFQVNVAYGNDATFQIGTAFAESGRFLAIQHMFRIATEPGTRRSLGGPFMSDYGRSLKGIKGWSDGDPFIVNYVGHPMEGAIAGYIMIQNDPVSKKLRFANNSTYWNSRLRAMAFAAAYSEQFEIGPVSEASIGNIQAGPVERGLVDHVVTPVVGFGWLVAEDAIDEHLVSKVEQWTRNPAVMVVTRSLLNPSRSFSNLMRLKPPWHRDTRAGLRR